MDNINISVITPSRGRIKILEQNFYNMYKLSKFSEKVESLIYLDEDDTESINFYNNNFLKEYYPYVKIFVGPRVGFKHMHVVLKNLAALSKGDIIFPVPDDANFRMKNWDEYLLQYKDRALIVYSKFRLAITRKAYEQYECIRNFYGCSRSEQKNNGPTDVILRKYAARKGIAMRCHKIYGESTPHDQTAQDGRGGQWSLQDTSILENLPIRELKP